MREIKFRVWNKTGEEMCYLLENGWSFGPSEEVRAFSWEDVFAAQEQDLIPLQYTGLKDKNGVEIFEGDLIERDIEVGGMYETYGASIVEYNEDEAMYCFEWDSPNRLSDYENLNVIGNIYENPELIK